MTAEFYLQTVDVVFQRHVLPKGELMHRGARGRSGRDQRHRAAGDRGRARRHFRHRPDQGGARHRDRPARGEEEISSRQGRRPLRHLQRQQMARAASRRWSRNSSPRTIRWRFSSGLRRAWSRATRLATAATAADAIIATWKPANNASPLLDSTAPSRAVAIRAPSPCHRAVEARRHRNMLLLDKYRVFRTDPSA